MKVFNSIFDFKSDKKTVVTLGTFDGVHFGHKSILNKLIESTINSDEESLVLTFFSHPRMILEQDSDIKLLNTIEEKAQLLKELGIHNLVIQKFDNSFSQLLPEDFVKQVLVDIFNVKKIIIGYDHRFGKNRAADINDLIAFGKKYNFEVEQISAEEIDNVSISSTKIRTALQSGNIKLANEYLGYPYFINGKVVKGKQLGRTIGYPTANIVVSDKYKLIPAIGVYAAYAIINDVKYYGMLNIGTNPTIGDNPLTIEMNIFDFDEDIYDQEIEIGFIDKIRNQQKFNSLDELKLALSKDKEFALNVIK
ncbi:bifunctional riboflavin kinase/FAD synthetase [Paenimyroides tangerinum]|uniref:Riboflavin biosynthesis protein n=1 Tax=Paenimyroides tangerinum TaxID=2488728 RepID=A0A3P3WB57_9FLAO|nr:bifunctional riboflavin kinase/FAD synthetase [Paenimyroides tangerinum]RRJ92422.1 bifunctional riboflavin kinase/FAD synthetase [Paenimyroides tangerinum]